MKNPVVQEDSFGCGAACLAFLTDATYQEITSQLGQSKAKTQGYLCKDLCALLNKYGFSCSYKYLKPHLKRFIYTNNTIVFIKRCNKYPGGHYLIRYKNLWMDPWVNFKTDKNIKNAEPAFTKRLPGKPIYAMFIKDL